MEEKDELIRVLKIANKALDDELTLYRQRNLEHIQERMMLNARIDVLESQLKACKVFNEIGV